MNAGEIVLLALGFVGVVVIVCRDAIDRPAPGDADHFTRNDERCQAVRVKQAKASERMKKLGVRSLLDGRAAWARINPMHVASEPAKVVSMRRKK